MSVADLVSLLSGGQSWEVIIMIMGWCWEYNPPSTSVERPIHCHRTLLTSQLLARTHLIITAIAMIIIVIMIMIVITHSSDHHKNRHHHIDHHWRAEKLKSTLFPMLLSPLWRKLSKTVKKS